MDERIISSCPFERAGKEYFSVWMINDWEMFLGRLNVMKEDYGEPYFVPFEDTKMAVMAHVENFLTEQFGDWQTLPPESDRRLYHGQDEIMPWRFGPTKGVL